MYLCWYDDNPKTPIAARIEAGRRAYAERFGVAPRVVLVSEAEQVEARGMTVLVKSYIRKNTYWFGMEVPQ